MRYRDLTTQSSRFWGILVVLDFFFRVIFRALSLFWSIKSVQRGFSIFLDSLWFWGYFGDFGSIMTILVISWVFLCQKKIYFNCKIYQYIIRPLNITKPLEQPPKIAKMTKMNHEFPKYPKTLENDQNAPKTMTTTPKTFKITKIPLKPQK